MPNQRPLYNDGFVDKLPNPGWGSPLVAYVGRAPMHEHRVMKEFLEHQYSLVPDHARNRVYKGLRSKKDDEFLAQAFELYVADFCRRFGAVDFSPKLENGKVPDLVWTLGDRRFIVDVVTIFDKKPFADEDTAVRKLLGYLGQTQHHFLVGVDYDSVNLHTLSVRRIRDRLVSLMDSLDPSTTEPREITYDGDGFVGRFTVFPRANPDEQGPITFGVMEPGRLISPVPAIRGRIKEKVDRYKNAGAVIVAVCKGGRMGMDWHHVATTLFGPTEIRTDHETGEYYTDIGSGGFVMPFRGQPPKNTSLTGVLYCRLVWPEEGPYLEAFYLTNPFAQHSANPNIPTYPVQSEGKLRFRWSTPAQQATLGTH